MKKNLAATFLAKLVALISLAMQCAYPQTFTVLHSFTVADGAMPNAGLALDANGNLYGTTQFGGKGCPIFIGRGEYYFGCGVFFKLDAAGTETMLYKFSGTHGKYPLADVFVDAAGNAYSTTDLGGAYGKGTVFKVDASGNETVLHSFTLRPDGNQPFDGLVRDANGNFYGTTAGGGASGHGTVFKLDATGRETVLYSFAGGPSGREPFGGVVRDSNGNLYGTALGGAVLSGIVFKVDATGKETVLYTFTGGTDGSDPIAGLFLGLKG